MPHMSPMLWMLMLINSWLMLTASSSYINFYNKFKIPTTKLNYNLFYSSSQWKW